MIEKQGNKVLKKILFTYLFIISILGISKAQDASFSQFYSSPVYLNPAMAGLSKCSQLHLHYRNQWPAISKAFETYHVSYDQYLPDMKSGIAAMITSNKQADGVFIQNQYSGAYDYQFQISRSVYVSMGLQFTIGHNSINPDSLSFYNNGSLISYGNLMNDPAFQNLHLNDNNLSRTYTDFSTGFVLGFLENYYVGAAIHHLNEPDISFYKTESSILVKKYTLQAGAIFLRQNSHYSKETVYLSPNLFIQQQGKFRQISLGFYTGINSFVIGSWYRHNFSNPDALVFLLGLRKDNFKFGYSYDLTISGLRKGPTGSHEVSISWDFCVSRKKKRRIRTIKCPTF